MKTATESPPLQAYFADVFLPRVLADVAEVTREKYRSSVRRLSDFLQRDATLEDLSDKTLGAMCEKFTVDGMCRETLQCHRQRLRSIAADAQKRGQQTGWLSKVDPLSNNVGGNRRQKFKRDVRGPQAKTARLLAKAAALYSSGLTFAEVALHIGVPVETLHTWRTRYRSTWDAAYSKATRSVVEGVKREAKRRADSIRESRFLQRAVAADLALREQGDAIAVDDGDPTAGKNVRDLIVDLNSSRAWAPTTLYQYECLLRRVERWSGRVLYCRDFAAGWVNKYLEECEASHLQSATLRGIRNHLLSLWRGAFDADLCPVEPRKIRKVKLIQKPPVGWLYDEAQRAVAQAATVGGTYTFNDPETGERITVERSKVLRLAIRVLWDSGLRPGDAFKLMMRDAGDDGMMHLTQSKTGRWHVCKLHASTLALARSVKRSAETRLICWGGRTYEHFRVEFRDLVTKPAGLVGSIKMFRKGSASDVEEFHPGQGAVHLGHRLTANIAHSHYLDPRVAFRNRAMPRELTADLPQAATA